MYRNHLAHCAASSTRGVQKWIHIHHYGMMGKKDWSCLQVLLPKDNFAKHSSRTDWSHKNGFSQNKHSRVIHWPRNYAEWMNFSRSRAHSKPCEKCWLEMTTCQKLALWTLKCAKIIGTKVGHFLMVQCAICNCSTFSHFSQTFVAKLQWFANKSY